MNGGGPFGLGPGQITGDGEQAMCLMHGLIHSNQDTKEVSRVMDCDKIAYYYSSWMRSSPFDVRADTRTCLEPLGAPIENMKAIKAKRIAWENNKASRSNGSLMRASPLAVWTSGVKSDKEIYNSVKADSEFTHPNELVV